MSTCTVIHLPPPAATPDADLERYLDRLHLLQAWQAARIAHAEALDICIAEKQHEIDNLLARIEAIARTETPA